MTRSPDTGFHDPGLALGGGGVPRHVAIIMDGNGRWAKARGLPRTDGHRHGLDALRGVIRHAGERGIDYLTVFSFSSENWSRPPAEVSFLMGLLRRFVQRDLSELHQANVRVRIIGEREGLEPGIRGLLEESETLTRNNSGLTLIVAFNYGARDELVRAMRRIAGEVAAGTLAPEAVTDQLVSSRLDTAGIPDPDLIIRTSGELRLSNFLLWQAAYAEFFFSPVLWPDFDAAAFDAALSAYAARERRFGGLTAAGR
ncbi:isoprenyl transferase [Microvirga tunisiensis]|uniref:Isoprenyl transferase n=2 Tax=Pannonibacter tanglangensis TaxID=2750084 RepID=A0ABW9ZCS8_9HYPH|nr:MULTISPECIES: isoprenyl transferase [unclassified Pannonibacter]NBN62311.1 isoprenyl transferase [Pannonibacter sp. XCT-34]NBN77977.1 isoprenyl transferase [Pannonibacter sp. XCT-53]